MLVHLVKYTSYVVAYIQNINVYILLKMYKTDPFSQDISVLQPTLMAAYD